MPMTLQDCVILGGGVAGLAAAVRLTELGIAPLVLESGTYPSHKVCGEFFSPSSLPLLAKWGLHPTPITHFRLHTLKKQLQFDFPAPAGGLSHLIVDPHLAKRAIWGGAEIRTET